MEDEREYIYLHNCMEQIKKNPFFGTGGIVNYLDSLYNRKEKVMEILRDHYSTSLKQFLKAYRKGERKVTPQLAVSFAQSFFTILANLESCDTFLLGLKPGNVFIEADHQVDPLGFLRRRASPY